MTTNVTRIATVLLVALLLACSKEPYSLEGEMLTGELPDQDLDVEAELADPGGEMHESSFDVQAPRRPCTDEELEQHRKENTIGGRINEEGIVCLRDDPPRPAPALPPAVTR
jgi:hypothetical protein